jgi:hypothetical protein
MIETAIPLVEDILGEPRGALDLPTSAESGTGSQVVISEVP